MISTHILDTQRGRPAAGIRVGLYRDEQLVSLQVSDADGRIADLSGGRSLGQGEYRLVFDCQGPFVRRLEVTIALEPGRHYHVPLLLSPYACVIYRGS